MILLFILPLMIKIVCSVFTEKFIMAFQEGREGGFRDFQF